MTALPSAVPQRRLDRIPYFEPVIVLSPVNMRTQAVDLGWGGIGLRSSQRLDVGTPIEMNCFIGEISGTVTWCKSLGSGFRIGAKFTRFDPEMLEQIPALKWAKR